MRMMLSVLLTLCGAASAAALSGGEEFVGPLAGWANVKTGYGAVGDGKADDTAAIQRAFDDLRFHTNFCVLYFPAGTYRITDMVKTVRATHHECMGITIVGEDPATTTLRWDGKEGGIMVTFNAWYSKISRLTLDGAGRAGVALSYGGGFSTYNETSDMVFTDVDTGMGMGNESGNGQAENAVLRCTFRRCKGSGLRTNGFNSLDIWAWYCRFEDCGYGLFNGAGNFHVFESLFIGSTKMDIGTANLMAFSFINNVSIGSKCFMDWASQHSWGSPVSITGNRIIEPTGDFAIRLGNGGPYLVADNVIKSRADSTKPVIQMTWGDQALIGNTYTTTNQVAPQGRFVRFAEKTVEAKSIDVAPPVLPPTPPRRERKVFDVAVGTNAAGIQAAIDQAVASKTERAVVHLPKGNYRINRTLVIPAGSDLQLLGDGAAETATVLEWTGEAGGLLLKLEGPSRATVRDLSVHSGVGRGILVEDCDQPPAKGKSGGRVFADQLNVSGMNDSNKPRTGILVNGVENGDVLMECVQGATFCGTWVQVIGGQNRRVGKSAPGQVTAIAGATGSADAQYGVSQGGRLVVRSIYHEMSGDAPRGILLNDHGSLSVDATRFSYKTSLTHPLIEADGFTGEFALLTNLLLPVNSTNTARIEMKGDGSKANLLCMGNLFWANESGVTADKVWLAGANPRAKGGFLLCNMNGGEPSGLKNGFGQLEARGVQDEAFILKMLEPLRTSRIWQPGGSPDGVTDVRFHRVIVASGKDTVGVEFRAGLQ